MQIQKIQNTPYENSFGSKVIMTPKAVRYLEEETTAIRKKFHKDLKNLENNGIKDTSRVPDKLGSEIKQEYLNADYVNDVNVIEEKNNLDEITSKINVIMDLREKIKFNINSNLLMDKLIIELGRCDSK